MYPTEENGSDLMIYLMKGLNFIDNKFSVYFKKKNDVICKNNLENYGEIIK